MSLVVALDAGRTESRPVPRVLAVAFPLMLVFQGLGAMFFHATYIKPDWAKGKRPLARIGGHVFYK